VADKRECPFLRCTNRSIPSKCRSCTHNRKADSATVLYDYCEEAKAADEQDAITHLRTIVGLQDDEDLYRMSVPQYDAIRLACQPSPPAIDASKFPTVGSCYAWAMKGKSVPLNDAERLLVVNTWAHIANLLDIPDDPEETSGTIELHEILPKEEGTNDVD